MNNDKQQMNKWSGCLIIGIIITVIDFFIMINQEDASTGAIITAIILIIGIIFDVTSVVKINVYNVKSINMSTDEYISDRFANAIPETKEVFGINRKSSPSVKCPYCQSTNVKKISTANRAVSVGMVGVASGKIGKEWHCNNCSSNF